MVIDEVKIIGDQCLMRWGLWARADGVVKRLGYPPCSPEQATSNDCVSAAQNLDEDALACHVDGVLSRMPNEYKLLAMHYYLYGLPLRKIARVTKCSRTEVSEKLDVLRGAVYGAIT